MDKCCNTMVRVPAATLFAFILLIVGMGLFIGPLIAVGERVSNDEVLSYITSYYEILKYVIIGVSTGMLVIGLFFMISSVLLSGERRKRIFWGTSRHTCARVLNSIAFFFCYVLLISWFIIACALLYPIALISYYGFVECKAANECLNARLLPPSMHLRNGTNELAHNSTVESLLICQENKQRLCNQLMQSYLIPFLLSFIGAFIIMLSFIHFLISISSNHAYIKADKPNMDECAVEAAATSPVVEETKM